MDTFQIIVGGITILGFILQVFGILKSISKTRNVLTLIFLGIFLGSLTSAFNQSTIKFEIEVDLLLFFQVLFLIFILISVIILFHSDEEHKKEVLQTVAIISLILFIFTSIFGNIITLDKKKLTNEEIVILYKLNIKNKNYEKSIELLNDLKSRYGENDLRRKEIEKKIDSLKVVQTKF